MTAYEMRISDLGSDVCSSDLGTVRPCRHGRAARQVRTPDRLPGNPDPRTTVGHAADRHPARARTPRRPTLAARRRRPRPDRPRRGSLAVRLHRHQGRARRLARAGRDPDLAGADVQHAWGRFEVREGGGGVAGGMRRARPTPGTVIPAHAGIQSTERKECAWKNSRLSTCLQVTVTERCMPVSPVICSSAHGHTAPMSWMAFPTSTGSGCWSGSHYMTLWKAPSFAGSKSKHVNDLGKSAI